MKKIVACLVILSAFTAYGQGKISVAYNKLTELAGTSCVIASLESWSKVAIEESHILFINTGTGETQKIDMPKDAYIAGFQQVKLDTLQLNKVVITAKTVNLNENKGIDWRDPMQVFVYSTDGKEHVKITPDNFFAGSWTVNRQTGVVVVLGHTDSNNSRKLDKGDQPEMILFDLKKMQELASR